MTDYIGGITFRLKIKDVKSDPIPMKAGLPQGGALSPTLFTVYTADTPKTPGVRTVQYADDTAYAVQDKPEHVKSDEDTTDRRTT